MYSRVNVVGANSPFVTTLILSIELMPYSPMPVANKSPLTKLFLLRSGSQTNKDTVASALK